MKTNLFVRLAAGAWLGLAAAAAPAAQFGLAEDGVSIDAGNMGRFVLTWPQLIAERDDQPLKPVEKRIDGSKAALKYAGGGELELAVSGAGQVDLVFKSRPASVQKLRVEMLIDFNFADGGTWKIGDGTATPFPPQKPAKPFLFQGNADRLQIADAAGATLAFAIPPYSFQQLQDNREWNWKTFAWMFITPLAPGSTSCSISVTHAGAAGGGGISVDRFGQDARKTFPGKVASEDELRADAAKEKAGDAPAWPPAGLDVYGGQTGRGAELGLKKTGFFHVEQNGGRWLMVTPDGNPVFHLGICSFQPGEDYTYIQGRTSIYEWLPPYESEFRTAFHPDAYWSRDSFSFYLANVIRKYGKPYDRDEWTARMIGRVRRWGFNAGGAFSAPTPAHQAARFPYVLMLPLGEWELRRPLPGVRGMFDPFDPATLAKMNELFARELPARAEEPLLIGYFIANEQAFEDLPRGLPSLDGRQPAKVRMVAWLKSKYADIGAFNRAWGLQAAGFEALADTGLAVATPAATADAKAFAGVFIEEYYRQVADGVRRHDRRHMLLGSRWQPRTADDEALCRAAGRHCDVISVNYYTHAVDTAYLKRLHEWTGGRPMMLSEFHWTSPSDTGLPGGLEVDSQRQRGLAYRHYVEQAAALGFIVGTEWFTLVDQARSGRFFERYNAEKANTGLFSVADRPYVDMLEEAAKTQAGIYDVLFGRRPPFRFDDPRFQVK